MFEARCRRAAVADLGVRPGEVVLDVGCGTGHALAEMARSVGDGGAVIGLDLSEAMLKRTQQRLRRAGVAHRARLVRADAAALGRPWPLDSGTVDVVFMSFTLELLDDEEARWVLRECRRLLRPEGRLGVAALSNAAGSGRRRPLAAAIYARLRRSFPEWLDCRPIHAVELVRCAGFDVRSTRLLSLWGLPVEVVVAVKGGGAAVGA